MHCPHCKQEHPDNVRFCPVTGRPLPTFVPQIACAQCGIVIPLGAVFCPRCGSIQRPKKARVPVTLLGLALAGILVILTLAWSLRGGLDFNYGKETPVIVAQELAGYDEEAAESVITADSLPTNRLIVVTATSTFTAAPTQTPTPTPIPVYPTDTPAPTDTPLPSPTPVVTNPIDEVDLVYIPEGEFIMGSGPKEDPYFFGSEGPQHMVYLGGYWIYRTEVTNAMYEKCVEANGCPKPINNGSNTRPSYYGNQVYSDHPVVYVTWRNASSYCHWAGGRLPTEAEWEKAARGTDGRLFPWGNQVPQPNHANYGARDTEAVGSYPEGASPYGVLDMAGNVIEWVGDYFQAAYYQVSVYENPLGPISGSTRVYRGGAYHNPAASIRTVMRGSRSESHANVDIGFRCVLDVPAE
jgi:formylglycine-generating enzyme required for sulfatase activity/predicted nucleic acid-binding Zn ribbon protein